LACPDDLNGITATLVCEKAHKEKEEKINKNIILLIFSSLPLLF
jgi:hypothetical protein